MSTHIVNKKLVEYSLGHTHVLLVFEDKTTLKFEAQMESYENTAELVITEPNEYELLLAGLLSQEECSRRDAARRALADEQRRQEALFQAWDLYNRYKDGIAKPLKLPDEVMDEIVNFDWASTQQDLVQVTCRDITFYFERPETT